MSTSYTRSATFAPGNYATQLFAAALAPPPVDDDDDDDDDALRAARGRPAAAAAATASPIPGFNATVLRATMRRAIAELGVSTLPWCSTSPCTRWPPRDSAARARRGAPRPAQFDPRLRGVPLQRPLPDGDLPTRLHARQRRTPLRGGDAAWRRWDGDDGARLLARRDGTWVVQAEGFVRAL